MRPGLYPAVRKSEAHSLSHSPRYSPSTFSSSRRTRSTVRRPCATIARTCSRTEFNVFSCRRTTAVSTRMSSRRPATSLMSRSCCRAGSSKLTASAKLPTPCSLYLKHAMWGSGPTASRKGSGGLNRSDFLQARQDFLGEEADAFFRFGVGHKAGAADQGQMAEAADLVVELHDLA